MALKYGFVNSGDGDKTYFDRLYEATQISNTFNGIVTQGVFPYIYINGIKQNAHFNLRSNGLNVYIGQGKAYYDNLWAYETGETKITVSNTTQNTKYIGIYLLFSKNIQYTSDTNIQVNDKVEYITIDGNDAVPTPSPGVDQYYMPIGYIKILSNATTVSVYNAVGSGVSIDSKNFSGCSYLNSNIGMVNLNDISEDGSWGISNGAYDQIKKNINSEYNTWLSEDIKESNFSNSSAGLVADYISRVNTVKKNTQQDHITIYIISEKQNMSGLSFLVHNNTYPQYADVKGTFSISDKPEATVELDHIGNYTITIEFKTKKYTYDINAPYFGEFYITVSIKFGEGDVFGFMVNPSDAEDIKYPQYYVYNTAIECANYEFEPTKIDWNNGGILDNNFETYWEGIDFLPSPVIIDSNGKEIYEMDKNDLTVMTEISTGKKVSALTITEMQEKGYNAMQRFPKVYVARFYYNGYFYCYISTKKIDDNFKCYAHINYKGEEIDAFYRSIYLGSYYKNSSGIKQLRSISGTYPRLFAITSWNGTANPGDESTDEYELYSYSGVKATIKEAGTINLAQILARNNNTSKPIWNIEGISDLNLIKDYVVLLTKSFRTYDTIGYTTQNFEALQNGLMDKKGQNYSSGKMTFDYEEMRSYSYYAVQFKYNIRSVDTSTQRYFKFLGIERLQSELPRYVLGIWQPYISHIAWADHQINNIYTGSYMPYFWSLMTKNTYGKEDKTNVTDWNLLGEWDTNVYYVKNVKYLTEPEEYPNQLYAYFDQKYGKGVLTGIMNNYNIACNSSDLIVRSFSNYSEYLYFKNNVNTRKKYTKENALDNINWVEKNDGTWVLASSTKEEQSYTKSWTKNPEPQLQVVEYSNEYGFIFTGHTSVMNYLLKPTYYKTAWDGRYASVQKYFHDGTVICAGPFTFRRGNYFTDNKDTLILVGQNLIESYNLFNIISLGNYLDYASEFDRHRYQSYEPYSAVKGNVINQYHQPINAQGKTITTDEGSLRRIRYIPRYSTLAAITCRPEGSVANTI